MSKYIPQVGDRIRGEEWVPENYVDVEYVGRSWFMGVNRGGHEGTWTIDGDWDKVEKPAPLPELWIRQYESGTVATFKAQPQQPLGVVWTTHLIPDGDGYRVEVARHARTET